MTTFNISLYDSKEDCDRIEKELLEAGFQASQVKTLRRDPKTPLLFLCAQGGSEDLETLSFREAREILLKSEVTREKSDDLLYEIQANSYLLVLRSGDELSGRAAEIMKKIPAETHQRENTYEEGAGGTSVEGFDASRL